MSPAIAIRPGYADAYRAPLAARRAKGRKVRLRARVPAPRVAARHRRARAGDDARGLECACAPSRLRRAWLVPRELNQQVRTRYFAPQCDAGKANRSETASRCAASAPERARGARN